MLLSDPACCAMCFVLVPAESHWQADGARLPHHGLRVCLLVWRAGHRAFEAGGVSWLGVSVYGYHHWQVRLSKGRMHRPMYHACMGPPLARYDSCLHAYYQARMRACSASHLSSTDMYSLNSVVCCLPCTHCSVFPLHAMPTTRHRPMCRTTYA